MTHSLQSLEKFLGLLHDVQRTKRIARRPNEREMTNTAEHTFELAMMCWYISAIHKLNLNQEKILKYSLAHDLIEAYAGDTPMHDKEARKTKAIREAEAFKALKNKFPEFGELIEIINEYELRSTDEAKLVYATDKLIDPLTASMEETQSIWKEFNVSWEEFVNYKSSKIALSETIVPYWQQLLKKLEAKKDFFFYE